MQQAHQQFEDNIQAIQELNALYLHLHDNLQLPNDLSDLLRAQLVYAVSALDKLVHELVQKGMTETFLGSRSPTRKYDGFTLSMATVLEIKNASIPPPEHYFGLEVFQRHKALSFQSPDKITDALSYIWAESHKWQAITTEMGLTNQNTVKTRLKAIVDRRNQIVHEADLDYNGNKNVALHSDIVDSVNFIKDLGNAIYSLVK